MTLPDLDIRTYIILALLAAGLLLILLTPGLRANLASWLVWLAGLLSGGATEYERRQDTPPGDTSPPDDPPTRDDYEREPIDPPERDRTTPDAGDDRADLDYWSD